MPVPKYDDLFNPLVQAIRELGGSASIPEQEDRVASILKLSNKDLAEIHRGTRTKFNYRLAWARNYLKNYGVLENSERGIWSLTQKGKKSKSVDKDDVKRSVNNQFRKRADNEAADGALSAETSAWEDDLLELVRSMAPAAFERLCQRLLRECGFVQVEVTGKTSDGGIDGRGVVRLGGLLSFHMIFQCKRFKGSVGAPVIRDFRGALDGRADKGLVITTGSFTGDARREAQREGAIPIDLIDGEALVGKLKELRIGVRINTKTIEEIEIDKDFFEGI